MSLKIFLRSLSPSFSRFSNQERQPSAYDLLIMLAFQWSRKCEQPCAQGERSHNEELGTKRLRCADESVQHACISQRRGRVYKTSTTCEQLGRVSSHRHVSVRTRSRVSTLNDSSLAFCYLIPVSRRDSAHPRNLRLPRRSQRRSRNLACRIFDLLPRV